MTNKGFFIGTSIAAILIILVSIVSFAGIIALVLFLLGHPEAIGEFFGKIFSGFTSVK